MNKFDLDTENFESGVTQSAVVARFKAQAMDILTEIDAGSGFLDFLERVNDETGLSGYVQINDGEWDSLADIDSLGRTLAFANQGDTIDAGQALALGLISGIIDDGQDLAEVCVEYIQTLSRHHREVLQSNRRSILPSAEEISTALDKYYDSMGTVIASRRARAQS